MAISKATSDAAVTGLGDFFGDRGGQPEADREQANQEQGDPTHIL